MLDGVLNDVLRPAHFYAGEGETLHWQHETAQDLAWEVFRGQLLGPAQTRGRALFDSWNVYRVDDGVRSAEPLLSLKLDRERGVVHVTRALFCHAWEGYHAGDNVYLSRETQRWVNELVGSVELARFPDPGELRDELCGLMFRAVVGVSRLPLTSVEAPLPDFSLGRLGYFPRFEVPAEAGPIASSAELLDRVLTRERVGSELSRLIELLIRSTTADTLDELAGKLAKRWAELGHASQAFVAVLRRMFDEVALSPHTGFIDRSLALLPLLVEHRLLSGEETVDFLSYLLRHLARHLTAYDLITFHHQGANYPDALLLDGALKAYLQAVETTPAWFSDTEGDAPTVAARKRIRRRALRQAWLLRRVYEGLPVPDAPTSPGENQRILPPPHVRVPEEQFDPEKRTRFLYAEDPLDRCIGAKAREVLGQAIADQGLESELRELGTAVFLDRPLGVAKPPAEPDRTLLFALEGFSKKIAGKRLDVLLDKAEGMVSTDMVAEWRHRLRALVVPGVDLPLSRGPAFPGKVSLDDVRKVSRDFVFTRTSRRSVEEFLGLFDFAPLREAGAADFLTPERRVVILRGEGDGVIDVHDAEYRKRLELQVDGSKGYETRGGHEYPIAGLTMRRVWNESGEVSVASLTLSPRHE